MEVKIFCKNDGKSYSAEYGQTLAEFAEKVCPEVVEEKTGKRYPVLAAYVDNKLKALNYPLYTTHEVEFIGFFNVDGRSCYSRSLCFVLQKVIRDLYPDKVLIVDYSLPSGLFCRICEPQVLDNGRRAVVPVNVHEAAAIMAKMQEIVDADLPFTRKRVSAEEAIEIFEGQHQVDKSELIKSLGLFSCGMYYMGGIADTFHGPLVKSTGCLTTFNIKLFSDGFCLEFPVLCDFNRVLPSEVQSKVAASLPEYSAWCEVVGIRGVGSLNKAINSGEAIKVINIAEALHERKYAAIANAIYERREKARIVFIAGPSSSGKTSSSLRIALHCKVLGLNPKVIELDNYFVERDKTPRDENGEYDYESLYAMDLELLKNQLNDLLDGKEVELPKFNFKTGHREAGTRMKLNEKDILIMEGIHALNPEMIKGVDSSKVIRVFVSALTSLNLDENNNIPTSDNRLLRRIVRDNRTRGITPEETILRWASVRRGEVRNIHPYQDNADLVFNSAVIFELPLLRYYAEPLLLRIAPTSPAYPTAYRLLKFLSYISPLQPSEIEAIPPTSIMREFIGGQTLS